MLVTRDPGVFNHNKIGLKVDKKLTLFYSICQLLDRKMYSEDNGFFMNA